MTVLTNNISGLRLPLITPFRDDELHEVSVSRLVKHYAELRIDGLLLAATIGEGLTLNAQETRRLVFTAAQANNHLPLYLDVSGSDTRKLVSALHDSCEWPIDGYLVACLCYSRPSQEGICQHISALSTATERPIVMYNIPYRTAVNMGNETLLRLVAHHNIISLKDCCADPAQSFELMQLRSPDFAVLSAEDAMFLAALYQGADGGIAGQRTCCNSCFQIRARGHVVQQPDACTAPLGYALCATEVVVH
jgi:4-hydroxy-tetrahydrodipicolinate synthase